MTVADENKSGSAAVATEPLTLWLMTDNKPGHRNQLQGLADRLSVHARINLRWIEVQNLDVSWQDFLMRRKFVDEQGDLFPDLVHRPLHGNDPKAVPLRFGHRVVEGAFGVPKDQVQVTVRDERMGDPLLCLLGGFNAEPDVGGDGFGWTLHDHLVKNLLIFIL